MSEKHSRREFLQQAALAAGTVAVGGALLENVARAELEVDRLPLTNTGPDRIPYKPLGSTGLTVSIIGVGGSTLGDTPSYGEAERIVHEAVDAGIQLLRQRLGISRRPQRRVDGQGAQGQARQGRLDDQGLHPRPRRQDSPRRCSTTRCAGCRPTISTCGRCTSASTGTIPSCTFVREASSTRSWRPRSRAKCASLDLPATSIPIFIWRC